MDTTAIGNIALQNGESALLISSTPRIDTTGFVEPIRSSGSSPRLDPVLYETPRRCSSSTQCYVVDKQLDFPVSYTPSLKISLTDSLSSASANDNFTPKTPHSPFPYTTPVPPVTARTEQSTYRVDEIPSFRSDSPPVPAVRRQLETARIDGKIQNTLF